MVGSVECLHNFMISMDIKIKNKLRWVKYFINPHSLNSTRIQLDNEIEIVYEFVIKIDEGCRYVIFRFVEFFKSLLTEMERES